MNKLRKAGELDWGEWKVLARAFAWLFAAEIALHLVSFRRVVGWVQAVRRGARLAPADVVRPGPQRLTWLVDVAARHSLFGPTCLRKSLVLCALLRRQGLDPKLVIGTRRGGAPAEGFAAHAWVELDGHVLGAAASGDFEPLAAFETLPAEQQAA